MKKVLIMNGQYLPGYKGGGPIQSCVNMVEYLSDQFEFKVICADRDFKETKPYEDVSVNSWNQVGAALVYYMSPDLQTLSGFKKLLNETDYDVLYLNGFFSPIFTIKPLVLRRLGRIKKKRTILVARGDLMQGKGRLGHKRLKKLVYITVAKLTGMYNDILWHATSEDELRDINRIFSKAKVYEIANLPPRLETEKPFIDKVPGKLKLVFISRITKTKNLSYALEVLKQINEGEIVFDIYGPTEDKGYWAECENLIREMPENVTVSYCGEIPHNKVPDVFRQYHAFFFPTLGENYGHIIVEAMMNNCLCILSEGTTPWDEYIKGLDIGAPLDKQERFAGIIKHLISADQSAMNSMLKYNKDYIALKANPDKEIELYKKLLDE
ncbi:glycosyltransferase family 4 protein [Butyrivibrio sp. MC2021]|uniref:glycosyltransferase family 4 protein n=1 Tax=Butyrivibrio sp. MC2021 TaxID=1408306 RepID=UPI00068464DF|nr:glycosyltransferase [Butyrivibrio sp. MC2021]